jgi:hypothetical protein
LCRDRASLDERRKDIGLQEMPVRDGKRIVSRRKKELVQDLVSERAINA